MKLAYFPNQTALQSEPVWRSFLEGWKNLGFSSVENTYDADAALIWSVLWQGRMRQNKMIYDHYRKLGKPVFIIEVGSLIRGKTWKIAVNNITNQGIYPDQLPYVPRNKIDIKLQSPKLDRRPEILIATQHEMSLQWEGMPSMMTWLVKTVEEIRKSTDLPVVLRPHPRGGPRSSPVSGVRIEHPKKLPNTYDQYDINFDYHCVINYNSGVAIQAAIAGTPVITGSTSLASELSGKISEISKTALPDRQQWFEKLLHTEWTIEEMAQGLPQTRLLAKIYR